MTEELLVSRYRHAYLYPDPIYCSRCGYGCATGRERRELILAGAKPICTHCQPTEQRIHYRRDEVELPFPDKE
jgi:hypothetical protein